MLLGRGHLGDGYIDFRPITAAVLAAGYTGYAEVEIFNRDSGTARPTKRPRPSGTGSLGWQADAGGRAAAEEGEPVPCDVDLQIKHEITGGPRAADQGAAVGGIVDRVRVHS